MLKTDPSPPHCKGHVAGLESMITDIPSVAATYVNIHVKVDCCMQIFTKLYIFKIIYFMSMQVVFIFILI